MSFEPIRRTFITSTITVFACAWTARGGDLNPPAGPVAPTMKTLVEVEPRIAINAVNTPGDANSLFKITQPGSYYLTGNVTGVAAKNGIKIAASGVTLDLMGFDLLGVPGSLDGVSESSSGLNNIEVRNGSVRAWGDTGIDLYVASPRGCTLSRLRCSNNLQNGMRVGIGAIVIECTASDNGHYGIFAFTNSTLADCVATGNGASGFHSNNGSTLTRCTAASNDSIGISVDAACTVTDCTASGNGGAGINLGGLGSTANGCTAYGNLLQGINVGSEATVADCSAIYNLAEGISTGGLSTVTGCTVSSNSSHGISAGNGSTVTGCTASGNYGDGIQVSARCFVRNNTCDYDGIGEFGGAGIHAMGSGNRIEGNNCTGSDLGIDVDSAGNVIVRNTCSGNTTLNWDIAANNVFGEIVDRTAPASAAVSGNSAGSSLGSTDSNANFTY